ncbi:hypothetical protein V8E53_000896, partial [Lactarius tabidus]
IVYVLISLLPNLHFFLRTIQLRLLKEASQMRYCTLQPRYNSVDSQLFSGRCWQRWMKTPGI